MSNKSDIKDQELFESFVGAQSFDEIIQVQDIPENDILSKSMFELVSLVAK